MSEPSDGDDPSDANASEPPSSELDRALDWLKRSRVDADDHRVTSDEHARMSWSSVTEAEPEPDPEPVASEPSFKFDLGSALARLGGESPSDDDGHAIDDQPIEPDPTPTVTVAPADELPTRRTAADPALAPAFEAPTERAADGATDRAADRAADLPTRRPTVEPSPGTPPPSALPTRGATVADEYPAALPQRAPVTDDPATDSAMPPADSDEPVAPSDPVSAPVVEPSARVGTPHRSVFDDAAPAPALPASPQRMPSVEPTPPTIPPGALPNLPTLPPATPLTAPATAEPVGQGPTAPDIHAVRSYQLRAQRDQRRSRVVARTLLVVLLLGAAVAAALFFGRSYLYPTEWDPSLTPIVDEIQQAHGVEFTEELPLETLDNAEYATLALELTVGDTWVDRLPDWRALGVASGAADSAAIVDTVVSWRPAIYDPVTDTVYRASEADPVAVDAALRAALEEVLARQHGSTPNDEFVGAATGVLGVSPLEKINSRAVDRELLVGAADTSIVTADSLAPLPLLYEFAAIDGLGASLVEAAGAAAAGWSYGDTYPAETLTATEVPRPRATAGPVPAGTEALAEPVALGNDDWSLIWASRLPASTVDRLSAIVIADAYRPVARSGARCFTADLETASEANANEVLGAMARWVAAGPPEAGGGATLRTPTAVEVLACDPGAATEIRLDPTAVTALLDRQAARL